MGDDTDAIPAEMKRWIDTASYQQLLSRWRFAPVGSPWFRGAVGEYYSEIMAKRKAELEPGEHAATSKRIGWD